MSDNVIQLNDEKRTQEFFDRLCPTYGVEDITEENLHQVLETMFFKDIKPTYDLKQVRFYLHLITQAYDDLSLFEQSIQAYQTLDSLLEEEDEEEE